jgi:hypothetical protein
MEEDMPGSVYVFNVTNQDLSLNLNGMPTAGGGIAGWSQSGAGKYQPSAQAVPRTLNASDGPGKFFNGNNSLSLQWPDGVFMAQVSIDGGALPLNQDLLLFVERNAWQLVNQLAVQVASGTVQGGWELAQAPDGAPPER